MRCLTGEKRMKRYKNLSLIEVLYEIYRRKLNLTENLFTPIFFGTIFFFAPQIVLKITGGLKFSENMG